MHPRGFTLLELLVVIGIIGVLAALVFVILNPAELQRKGRDTRRLNDLETLRKAIDLTLVDTGGPLSGSANVTFREDSAATRSANTSGNYVGLNVGKYLPILPDDPQHVAGSNKQVTISDGATQVTQDNMRYYFGSDGSRYEINAYLESADNNNKASNAFDGGDSSTRYEMGTSAGLSLVVGP